MIFAKVVNKLCFLLFLNVFIEILLLIHCKKWGKNKKSEFALLVCCFFVTFSSKIHANHNFFLAVASQNQNIIILIFFMILKCPDFSGAKLKIIFKKYQNSPKFTENMKIPLLLCSKNIWKSSKINENHQAFLSIWKIPY